MTLNVVSWGDCWALVEVCALLRVILSLPAAFSPVQTHALVKQQLSCPSGQRVAHHQLILQQTTAGALNHRHLQPIALRVAPQEANSHHLPLHLKRLTTPSTQSHTNSHPHTPSSSTLSSSSSSITSVFASSAQNSIPAATVQPQPPPLVAAPQRRTLFPQVQNQPPPPPPPLVLPRLPQNPPASLQRLSLHSVRALSVQSGQMLLTEQELPVAEALLQMPYQNLPPPQTVAVDLKVHGVRRNDNPPVSRRVLSGDLLYTVCSGLTEVLLCFFNFSRGKRAKWTDWTQRRRKTDVLQVDRETGPPHPSLCLLSKMVQVKYDAKIFNVT